MHRIVSTSVVLGLILVTVAGAGCVPNQSATNTVSTNNVANSNVPVIINRNTPTTNANGNAANTNANVVTEDVSADFGEEFDLQVNQAALVGDEVEVMVQQASNDSRCPEDAECVTAGTVSVVVSVVKDGEDLGNTTITGSGSSEDPATETIEGYTVTVFDVTPLPETGVTTAQDEYTVTLQVEKE